MVTSPKEHRRNTGTLALDSYTLQPPDLWVKVENASMHLIQNPETALLDGSGEHPQTESLEGYWNVLMSDTPGSLYFPKSNFFSL